MATFTHGKSAKILVNGYDLTSYLKSGGVAKTADTAETSALGDAAKTYVPGQGDATFSGEGMMDGTVGAVDDVFNTALGADGSELAYLPAGDALGQTGYGLQSIVTSYEVTSPVDDVVQVSMEAQGSGGAERVVTQHALAARTGTSTGTGVDGTAATSAGAAAYLHVTGRNGAASAVVKIQDSADNSTFADIVTFATVAADHASERVEIAGAVRRYTRASWTVTGGTATFWAGICRTPN